MNKQTIKNTYHPSVFYNEQLHYEFSYHLKRKYMIRKKIQFFFTKIKNLVKIKEPQLPHARFIIFVKNPWKNRQKK